MVIDKARLTTSVDPHAPVYQILTWAKVREQLQLVKPDLCALIDEMDPSDEYYFYKVSYPYGSEIVLNGDFGMPSSHGNGLQMIRFKKLAAQIQQDLGYNLGSNPAGIVLSNSPEIYMMIEDRIVSFGMSEPGRILGLWRVLDPKISYYPVSLWNITAGARSMFMLPKITEKSSYNRLRKAFHLDPYSPKRVMDHWNMFRGIANHPDFHETWSCEILFFTSKWFEKLEDPAWLKFHRYLLKYSWNTTQYWRNKFIWDLTFSRVQARRNIKPSPFVADTVKHLIVTGVGDVPGYAPSLDDSAGPVAGLQEVYLEVYQLKNYVPTMMQPTRFNMMADNNRPVYYSLQLPTAIELAPKASKRSSTISDLYEVKSLLEKYYDEMATGKLNLEYTPLHELTKRVGYTCFHTDVGDYSEIMLSGELPEMDPSFITVNRTCRNVEFSANSNFVRGCIRLASTVGK